MNTFFKRIEQLKNQVNNNKSHSC